MLLCLALAFAQESPAPPAEATPSAPAEAAPAGAEPGTGGEAPAAPVEAVPAEAVPAAPVEAPPVDAAPAAIPAEALPLSDFERGKADGVAEAELDDSVPAAAYGALLGLGAGCVGVGCFGIAGVPLVLVGPALPLIKTGDADIPPPPGAWEAEGADYRAGYAFGYEEAALKERKKRAILGASAGALVGAAGGAWVVILASNVL